MIDSWSGNGTSYLLITGSHEVTKGKTYTVKVVYKNPRNRDCGRYQKEKSIQIQLHRVERDAKRAARAERAKQRKCECEVEEESPVADVMLD